MNYSTTLLLIILLMYIPFWLRVLANILKSEFKEPTNKIVWVMILIFLPIIGEILYESISPNQKKKRDKAKVNTEYITFRKEIDRSIKHEL